MFYYVWGNIWHSRRFLFDYYYRMVSTIVWQVRRHLDTKNQDTSIFVEKHRYGILTNYLRKTIFCDRGVLNITKNYENELAEARKCERQFGWYQFYYMYLKYHETYTQCCRNCKHDAYLSRHYSFKRIFIKNKKEDIIFFKRITKWLTT